VAVTNERPAPYAPTTPIVDLIGRFRSRGLPMPVDAEVLARAGVSHSLIPRTLYALQVLDLIDADGNATPIFEGLRLAPEGEFKARMADWVRGAYADVFSFVDLGADDDTSIRDAFRSYQPVGQQGRMVTLFQGLCIAAGLISAKKPSTEPQPVRIRQTPVTKRATFSIGPKATKAPVAPSTPVLGTLPPALAGLLASLPRNGWDRATRDRFVATLTAVLDFCYPIEMEKDPFLNEIGDPK
jgi:hypothetical protein